MFSLRLSGFVLRAITGCWVFVGQATHVCLALPLRVFRAPAGSLRRGFFHNSSSGSRWRSAIYWLVSSGSIQGVSALGCEFDQDVVWLEMHCFIAVKVALSVHFLRSESGINAHCFCKMASLAENSSSLHWR